jgi:sugar lactone lactonase YvrE
MSQTYRIAFLAAALALAANGANIQSPASTNDLPNPYHEVQGWAQLPSNIEWGAVIGVDPDAHGNLWVLHRKDPSVLEFDASGKLVTSFATGLVQAHGLAIDHHGNIWITDAQDKGGKGQQVFEYSPQGKLLMTLGKAGVSGAGPDTFNGPSDLVVNAKGEIFVADGHYGQNTGRIVKFSKDGKFLKEWGKKGSGPGEFDEPHSMALDSKGRLFVADRKNNRIQIFDQDGKFIDQWKQFGKPSGIWIGKDDTLYSIDSQSDEKTNPGVKRGVRIGSAKDGSVKYFIPDTNAANNPLGEGVCATSKGEIFVAGVSTTALHKFVK